MNSMIIKKVLPHLIALAIFAGLSAAYFYPQLEGKVVQQSDMISHLLKTKEMRDYEEEHGLRPLWTNAMFGGMPTYQMGSPQRNNKLKNVSRWFQLGFDRPAGLILTMLISSYIMFLILGINPWVSIIGSLILGFSTNNMLLLEAGHNTKMQALAFSPIIIGSLILLFRKHYLSGGMLFALGIGLNLSANHVQMTYYLFMALGFFFLIRLIRSVRQGELIHFGKAAGIMIIGIALALGATASKLWTTYEYSKDTMRGEPILEKTNNQSINSSSETKGLNWEYAMQWSNGFLDVVSTYIPGVVGGGSQEPVSRDAEVIQDLRSRGVNTANIDAVPMYWGPLPFTGGPPYFGAVLWFFFVLGFVLVKGNMRWWVLAAVVFTMIISMGKHFELINRPLFDYLPLLNKFRAPNSILGVTVLFVALLGGIGLWRVYKRQDRQDELLKAIKYAAGIMGGIALLFLILGPSMSDFQGGNDASMEQQGWNVSALRDDRASLMRADSIRSLLFVLAAAALVFGYMKRKVNANLFLLGIGLLALFDLWNIDRRYLGEEDFVQQRRFESAFEPRPSDQQILNAETRGRGYYRVLDLSINTFNSAQASYFHNTVGGYHAAKLQRYQDLIDYHISQGNQQVLNMLNTKYIIGQQGNVQVNNSANGTAWYVSVLEPVESPEQEVEKLTEINTARQAVILQDEFEGYVDQTSFEKGGSIELVEYEPVRLVYNASAPSRQFAVFSEIWYGPDKGWQAFIDDEPVEHVRVNYLLRGMYVPEGEHVIEFRFRPAKYYTGETVSLISSLLIILGLLAFLGWRANRYLKRKEVGASEVVTTVDPAAKPRRNARKRGPKKRRKK